MNARWTCLVLAVALAAPATLCVAQPTASFSQALPAEQKVAAGLERLSDAEVAALDAAVQREITLAIQGDVYAFAGSFSGRRTEFERKQMGFDRLTAQEVGRIDGLVAHALADRPRVVWAPRPTAASSGVTTYTPGPVTHGSVTVAYVWDNNGGSGVAAALDVVQTWPSGRSLAVGISDFRGSGFSSRSFGMGGCWRR